MTESKNTSTETPSKEDTPVDNDATDAALVREKLLDGQTPGYQAEFDPAEAELAGAFVEDALSEEDAMDSAADLEDALTEEQLAHLDKSATNSRESTAELLKLITNNEAKQEASAKRSPKKS